MKTRKPSNSPFPYKHNLVRGYGYIAEEKWKGEAKKEKQQQNDSKVIGFPTEDSVLRPRSHTVLLFFALLHGWPVSCVVSAFLQVSVLECCAISGQTAPALTSCLAWNCVATLCAHREGCSPASVSQRCFSKVEKKGNSSVRSMNLPLRQNRRSSRTHRRWSSKCWGQPFVLLIRQNT